MQVVKFKSPNYGCLFPVGTFEYLWLKISQIHLNIYLSLMLGEEEKLTCCGHRAERVASLGVDCT